MPAEEQLTAEEAKAIYECAWRENDVPWNPDFAKNAYDTGMTKLDRIANTKEEEEEI